MKAGAGNTVTFTKSGTSRSDDTDADGKYAIFLPTAGLWTISVNGHTDNVSPPSVLVGGSPVMLDITSSWAT